VAGVVYIGWSQSSALDVPFGPDLRADAAFALIALAPIASCVAVCIRRLHDRNRSAWWLLLYVSGPLMIEAIASLNNLDTAWSVNLMILAGAASIWAFVELGFVPGTGGANRYGPAPLEEK
jgi:uncharacterized membrane protein YhaH (DUF805 family)